MTSNVLPPDALAALGPDALTARIAELLGAERACIVEFLHHLAELDRRQTYLELGFPSLFAYCTDALHLPKASAWRRTTSARLLVRFPAAAEFLADGRLCLTTFVLLKDVLEPQNHLELLERASHRSEDEVQQLVATLRPRPEVRTTLRRLPEPTPSSGAELPLNNPIGGPDMSPLLQPGGTVPSPTTGSGPELRSQPMPSAPRPPRIEPIDAARHSLKMTVGAEFMTELAEVKSALSHLVPDGDLETILRLCMQKTLEDCRRRQRGARTAPARSEQVSKKPSRNIPAAVRRAVWARDQGRCAFVGSNGRRCNSRHQLELDHVQPYARGGPATVENLRLACRAHNLHHARKSFGDTHMARYGLRSTAAPLLPGSPERPERTRLPRPDPHSRLSPDDQRSQAGPKRPRVPYR